MRALEAIGLQERSALERFYAAVRKTTPQMQAMAERYGGDVSFNFDSNGRSVWVMALFGKGAAPVALLRLGSGQASILRDGPSSRLRTGPAGLLRSSGRGDGIPLDDEQDDGGNEEEG